MDRKRKEAKKREKRKGEGRNKASIITSILLSILR